MNKLINFIQFCCFVVVCCASAAIAYISAAIHSQYAVAIVFAFVAMVFIGMCSSAWREFRTERN